MFLAAGVSLTGLQPSWCTVDTIFGHGSAAADPPFYYGTCLTQFY